ncbi:hypothetical protein EYR40_003174 [Pleurotus pulmonarius]|nr:hypothetical protein EYR40_003174 [Pleurotus pulmonarius]
MVAPALPHVARQESSTTGEPSPTPPSTPQFFFGSVTEMATCRSASIFWSYAGPSAPFQLIVTNNDVSQTASIPSLPSSTPTPTTTRPPLSDVVAPRAIPTFANLDGLVVQTISTSFSPFDNALVWGIVNVPQGWYKLASYIAEGTYSAESRPFFVRNSTDVSCLVAASPPSSSSSPTSSSTSSSASASASATQIPVPVSASSSRGISAGAIAGIVVGAAILVAGIAAFFFIRSFKSPSRRGQSNHWGGLASSDSQGGSKAQRSRNRPRSYLSGGASAFSNERSTRAQRHDSRTDSINPINASRTKLSSPIPAASQRMSEDDISSSVHSPFDEKYAEVGGMADMLPPLPLNRDTSVSTTTTRTTRRSSTSSVTQPRGRRVSVDRTYQHSTATGELIPMTPSPSSPSSPASASHTSPYSHARDQSLSASTPSIIPPGSLSPGNSGQPRRTPRKPVPSYNPNDISLSPFLPSPEPPRSASAATYHPSSSTDILGDGDNHSIHHRAPEFPDFPELSHKASFGDGRPVHYLIPDMPPPQRD